MSDIPALCRIKFQSGIYQVRGHCDQTVVHTATNPELSTRLAKTGIREDRDSGFGPLGSHPVRSSFHELDGSSPFAPTVVLTARRNE